MHVWWLRVHPPNFWLIENEVHGTIWYLDLCLTTRQLNKSSKLSPLERMNESLLLGFHFVLLYFIRIQLLTSYTFVFIWRVNGGGNLTFCFFTFIKNIVYFRYIYSGFHAKSPLDFFPSKPGGHSTHWISLVHFILKYLYLKADGGTFT